MILCIPIADGKYPAYTARAWEKLAREWKDGVDTFAEFGARWDGEPDPEHETLEGAEDPPVTPVTGPLPYTEVEELAMGQFVLHQESEGKHVTGGSWSIFAEVVSTFSAQMDRADGQYPQRTKGAYAEHYRVFKQRIMDIVHRHNENVEANRQDSDDPDPTYSDRSPSPVASGSQPKPKKQKVAVSKKDYEDLARFIVDNIAEGDVPDSKNFAAFSKDVSDPPRCNGESLW
jgi:anthranilate/para-aminobenzoate synthase component I